MKKNNFRNLDKFIQNTELAVDLIRNQNGKELNSHKHTQMQPVFFHTTTDNITADQSAEFERNNKKIFSYLLDIKESIKSIFNRK